MFSQSSLHFPYENLHIQNNSVQVYYFRGGGDIYIGGRQSAALQIRAFNKYEFE